MIWAYCLTILLGGVALGDHIWRTAHRRRDDANYDSTVEALTEALFWRAAKIDTGTCIHSFNPLYHYCVRCGVSAEDIINEVQFEYGDVYIAPVGTPLPDLTAWQFAGHTKGIST